MFALCIYSVCLHAWGSFLGVVLRVHGVASTSLRQQSCIRRSSCTRQCSCGIVLAARRVRHSPALFTLDIFLLNKKNNPGGELPLLLEKVPWCARFSFRNGDCSALAAVVWLLTASGFIDERQINVSRADARPCKHNQQTAQT